MMDTTNSSNNNIPKNVTHLDINTAFSRPANTRKIGPSSSMTLLTSFRERNKLSNALHFG